MRVVKEHEASLQTERYHYTSKLLGVIKALESLKWANTKEVKDTFDAEILALLGEKTAADSAKPAKKSTDKSAPPAPKSTQSAPAAADEQKAVSLEEEGDDFLEGRPIPEAVNTEAQLAAHLKVFTVSMLPRLTKC